MEPKLIVANFKMNLTIADLKEYFHDFPEPQLDSPHTIVFCPAFTALDFVHHKLTEPYQLGAQDVHPDLEGACTGEVSAPMLTELGVKYVIVGHHERRRAWGDSNRTINHKVLTALASGMKVILCVGENQLAHEKRRTRTVLTQQITAALRNVNANERDVYIAYEPVWAIGSGTPATLREIGQAAKLIKKICRFPMLYGGGVSPENAREILELPDVDGVLVGGASLDPEKFARICQLEPRA